MRNVIVSMYLSLDGVMEQPSWTMPYWSAELAAYAKKQLFASDALLLGRVTYAGFAQAWPTVTDNEGFADRMNGLPKFVATTTLTNAEWNNTTLLSGNIAEQVAALKAQPGQDILIYGSGDLIATLRENNLIDEYRLWVHPIVLGTGKRFFPEGSGKTELTLVDTKTFDSGVVILVYKPAVEAL